MAITSKVSWKQFNSGQQSSRMEEIPQQTERLKFQTSESKILGISGSFLLEMVKKMHLFEHRSTAPHREFYYLGIVIQGDAYWNL